MMDLEKLVEIEMELRGGILNENYNELSNERCRDLVVTYLESVDVPSINGLVFVKSLSKVGNHVVKLMQCSRKFLENLYTLNMRGAEMVQQSRGPNERRGVAKMESHFFSHGGDIAMNLFRLTGDLSWLEKCYEHRKKAGDMNLATDSVYAANVYSFASDAAKDLFRLTGNALWAMKWYEADFISGEVSSTYNLEHSLRAYSYAGDAAKILFDLTEDKVWLVRGYNCYKLSGEKAEGRDAKHRAYCCGFAGELAYMLYVLTKENSWREKSIPCCNEFLIYFRVNPDRSMQKVIEKVEGIVLSFAS